MSPELQAALASPEGQAFLDTLAGEQYLQGAIDVARELLRFQLERRDDYTQKAEVVRLILDEEFGGEALKNSTSYLLATSAIKWEANANACQVASDEIEAVLENLTAASAKTVAPPKPITFDDPDEEGLEALQEEVEAALRSHTPEG